MGTSDNIKFEKSGTSKKLQVFLAICGGNVSEKFRPENTRTNIERRKLCYYLFNFTLFSGLQIPRPRITRAACTIEWYYMKWPNIKYGITSNSGNRDHRNSNTKIPQPFPLSFQFLLGTTQNTRHQKIQVVLEMKFQNKCVHKTTKLFSMLPFLMLPFLMFSSIRCYQRCYRFQYSLQFDITVFNVKFDVFMFSLIAILQFTMLPATHLFI